MTGALLKLARQMGLDRLAYRLWRYNPSGLHRLYRHHRFDHRHRVETRGYGDLRYEPSPDDVVDRILALLDIDASKFTFIDVGSGKGKVLLLAAAHPFRRVIGVERFQEFHDVAVTNLSVLPDTSRRCGDIESLCVDAAAFEWPNEPSIVYFFNPFAEDILEPVLRRIEESVTKSPRELYLAYFAPILKRGAPWDRRRVFDRSRRLSIVHDETALTVYRALVNSS